MSKWKMVRLGDIATYINGYAFKPSDWSAEGLPIVRIQNLTGNAYETNYYNGEYNARYEIDKGDILISWSASLGVYEWQNKKALLNQHIFKVIFDKVNIDKSYFRYTVSKALLQSSNQTHGSTMKHLTKGRFDNIEIPLPPLEEQKKIANELDKINTLIEKRKIQIEKLDLLVKAKFVEMFGDPVENPMGWKVRTLLESTNKIGSGSTPTGGKKSYKATGISLIRSMNVHNGHFKFKDLAFIDDIQAKKLNNVTIEKNDVLINITGASVARCCIVPEIILPARVNQHVSILRCKDSINNIFLNNLLISNSCQKQLLEIGGSGATREAITKPQLENFQIITPPLRFQNQFADYVKKVESTKQTLETSLTHLETLYKQRMQHYFE